jgi:CheY-like chemotaxis protein
MKSEIRCDQCNTTWHVDPSTACGEMLCPVCLTRIRIEASTTAAAGKPATGPAPARPARGRSAAGTAAVAIPDEVVCPRCRLHFSPHSKRSRPDPATTRQRKTVLVVEDQKYFREVAADALRAAFDVRTAATSQEARAALGAGGIDALVLDLTLDGDDSGRQLLMTLRPKPCPIVIFTAEDESQMYRGSWEELARLGADELVIKGMNVGESLLRKVAALLGTPLEELEAAKQIG